MSKPKQALGVEIINSLQHLNNLNLNLCQYLNGKVSILFSFNFNNMGLLPHSIHYGWLATKDILWQIHFFKDKQLIAAKLSRFESNRFLLVGIYKNRIYLPFNKTSARTEGVPGRWPLKHAKFWKHNDVVIVNVMGNMCCQSKPTDFSFRCKLFCIAHIK